jgi:CBS domain-containing protein
VSDGLIHLSSLRRSPLTDPAGDRLGRVEDVIVRLGEGFPPVTGLRARIGGRDVFVPTDRIGSMAAGHVQLSGEKLNLGRFERRAGEVLLAEDILGRKLIDVEDARLVTAHDIELACIDGWWRVIGINPSPRARVRRLLSRASDAAPDQVLKWTQLEPFVGHVPTSRLRLRSLKLVELHPAQIADLVEAASHDEGEEIIEAVGADRELEADVFEELDDEHQVEFLRERSDAEAAKLIARMATDDAADVIVELEQERRQPILDLLPAAQQRQIRALLGYNPSTAGGLMSPEFIYLPAEATVEEAVRRVRDSDIAPEAATTVYIHDADRRLIGSLPIVTLLRADAGAKLVAVADDDPQMVRTDADLPDIARIMTDFNLTVLPVVDDDGRAVGVVTVDDILELMLPPGWRRRWRAMQS